MAITPDIQQIIERYYPSHVDANQAAYYITPQHQQLRQIRATAEQNHHIWLAILQEIQQVFPEYAIQDFSNLSYNNCYQGEMLLHPHVSFMDDDIDLLAHLKGRRLTLWLLVSILGPFYHLYIEETRYHFETEQFQFQIIPPENETQAQIISRIQTIVEQHGYQWLDQTTLTQTLPNLTTEFKDAGQVTVGDCLFSDTGQY